MAGPTDNLPDLSSTDDAVTVLVVSPHERDHAQLGAIFQHSNWRIDAADDRRGAMTFLKRQPTATVICEAALADGGWKSLFTDLLTLPAPPVLIVSAADPDEKLWAEVLNLGAYDVLSKPFERAEVIRIVSLAWLHWRERTLPAFRKPSERASAPNPRSRHAASA